MGEGGGCRRGGELGRWEGWVGGGGWRAREKVKGEGGGVGGKERVEGWVGRRGWRVGRRRRVESG